MKKPALKNASALAADLLLRPSKALDRMTGTSAALGESALIYAAYLAASAVFYTLKPPDFPPVAEGAPVVRLEGGLLFWLKVLAWNPFFTVVGIALTAWYARLLYPGRLAFRLVLSCAATALPLIALLAYTNNSLSKPLFALAWLALLLFAAPGFLRVERVLWPVLFSIFLSINAVALALLPLFCAAIFLRVPLLYHGIEIAMMFWMLGLAAYGVHRAAGLPTARAFCAIFLSALVQVFFVFSLHMLGLIPKDALKALMIA